MKKSPEAFMKIVRFIPVLFLILLLLFPALSVQGAANGLLLWFNVVLPTLAPFIICTQAITALDGVSVIIRPVYPLVKALFGLSPSGAYVFICGLLCGYPLGARLCADYLKAGKISEQEAAYLLAFCNHPSPMFLSGYVCAQLNGSVSPILLFVLLYLPIIPVAMLARYCYRIREPFGEPELSVAEVSGGTKNKPFSLDELIYSTCETMVLIGGYIMLFSIFALWLQHAPYLPAGIIACLCGILEITTGVNQICRAFPLSSSLLPVVAIVAFGGCSGIFQTKSVIKNARLSIRHYVAWKFVHMLLACVCFILLSQLPVHLSW